MGHQYWLIWAADCQRLWLGTNRRQAITWTNADVMSIGSQDFEFEARYQTFFPKKIYEKICKMAAILFRSALHKMLGQSVGAEASWVRYLSVYLWCCGSGQPLHVTLWCMRGPSLQGPIWHKPITLRTSRYICKWRGRHQAWADWGGVAAARDRRGH